MNRQELYLKTIICCIACDGDIADEEVALVREIAQTIPLFAGKEVEHQINTYVAALNEKGKVFLNDYLQEVAAAGLTPEEERNIVDIAITMIEADKVIKYSEVKFFKKIRACITLSDEEILEKHPDKEDFLLPDIAEYDDTPWNAVTFANISLNILASSAS